MEFFSKLLIKFISIKLFSFYLLFFIFVSYLISSLNDDPNYFSASGGVATILGLLMLIRYSTLEHVIDIQHAVTSRHQKHFGFADKFTSETTIQENNIKVKNEISIEIKGLIITMLGTLIWAYGFCIPLIPTESIAKLL